MLSIKNTGSNYLARVIRLPTPRKHSNADKLLCVNILNNNVITGLSAVEGALYVYFPLECAINLDYLSWSNSFSDAERNHNKSTKGFFPKNGRVRCLKLRGEKSEGYIVPAVDLNHWLGKEYITEANVDQDFDTIGDILLCQKYVPITTAQVAKEKKVGKKARESKIIEGQYYLAADTENLKRNIHKINPNDIITISYKMHGANFSAGNVLCKRPLKWHEKIASFAGLNIVNTCYDLVYASRRVVKNRYADSQSVHYYNMDIWGVVADQIKNSLEKGITIHGEIVNQLPNNSWIQKHYDYGHAPGTVGLYVYRIFLTNPDGKVFEFNTDQVVQYCKTHNLNHVPIFYQGKAKDLFPELDTENHWHENFLEKLIGKYNEKDCFLCKNKVPEEGIVLTKNTNNSFESYKLKSFRFLERESKELDSGEANIEDIN